MMSQRCLTDVSPMSHQMSHGTFFFYVYLRHPLRHSPQNLPKSGIFHDVIVHIFNFELFQNFHLYTLYRKLSTIVPNPNRKVCLFQLR